MNRLRAWGPAATWAVVLFLLSAWPNPSIPDWVVLNDKIVHAGLYAVLGAGLGFGRFYDTSPPPHFVLIGLGALYGATDEWHQDFVSNRSPDLGDWFADVGGVVIGYTLILLILIRFVDKAVRSPIEPSTDG